MNDQIVATHERLRRAFDAGRTRLVDWRKQQLRALVRMLEQHEADFVEALRLDLGKGRFETALSETGFVVSEAQYALRHLDDWVRPRRVGTPLMAQPGRSWIQAEPRGLVLIIAPWNY